MSQSPDDKSAREIAEEAKSRIRTAVKMYHNANDNWGCETVGDTGLTYWEWIDAGIDAILSTPSHVRPTTAPQPDDVMLMPRKLTAENGMKGAMIGEFSFKPYEDADPVYVPWDTIKAIYDRAVTHLGRRATPSATATTKKEDWWELANQHAETNLRFSQAVFDAVVEGKDSQEFYVSIGRILYLREIVERHEPEALRKSSWHFEPTKRSVATDGGAKNG